MQTIPRKSSRVRLGLVRSVYRLGATPTFLQAYRGKYGLMRTLFDFAGNRGVSGVTAVHETLGGVSALRLTPERVVDDRVLLYCHGGGYCVGSLQSHRHMCSMYARVAGRVVILFDYRLAPEHPYPAAIEDGVAVYQALLQQVAADKVVLMGDSAGGGMVLALAQYFRDHDLPQVAGLVPICPWVDYEVQLALASDVIDTGLPLKLMQAFGRDSFPGAVAAEHNLLHTSVENLPPTFLLIGGADTLYAEDLVLAEKLAAASNKGVTEIWEGMPHVWQTLNPFIHEAEASAHRMKDFIDTL